MHVHFYGHFSSLQILNHPNVMEMLTTISTAVNAIHSKLNQVITAVQQLNDRQDGLETSLEQIRVAVAVPHPPSLPVTQLPPPPSVTQPPPLPAVTQPPPPPAVTQPPVQAPRILSHYQAVSTLAFNNATSVWYHTSSSFVEEPSADDDKDYMDHNIIMQICRRSASRKNFASLIAQEIFTEQERLTCNVNGRGKPKLDEQRIAYIKKVTFQFWPLTPTERPERAWADCVITIDEANRQMKRNK